MRNLTFTRCTTLALAIATTGLGSFAVFADDLSKDVLNVRIAQVNDSARSQASIDRLSSESDELLAELRKERETIRNLEKYNKRLRGLIDSQEEEKRGLQKDIDGVTSVERGILPLMERMIDALDAFVGLDVPFSENERTSRVESLRTLMDRADVSVAEKYRRLTEAYQIENEFGRTMEAYDGTLGEGEGRTVEFLRVGRVLLVYRTADGDEMGYWDKQTKGWQPLDSSYRTSVDQAIRIARKLSPPDLVTLPVQGPTQEAQ